MMFTKFDKATAAALGAALAVIINHYYPTSLEVQGALAVILGFLLTYFVPNKAK